MVGMNIGAKITETKSAKTKSLRNLTLRTLPAALLEKDAMSSVLFYKMPCLVVTPAKLSPSRESIHNQRADSASGSVTDPRFSSLKLMAKIDATATPIVMRLTTDQISLFRWTRMTGL